MAPSYSVRSTLYTAALIPSIICATFLLYHLISNSALRRALHNHSIILIVSIGLLYEITDIVWLIYYYHTGSALISHPTFCLAWVLIDTSGYVTLSILVAWASMERHILIFHQNWLTTRTQRVFIHYLPLLVFALYPSTFYVFIYCVIPCAREFDYNAAVCDDYVCVGNSPTTKMWDGIVNFIMPIFTIVIFSVALLIRVIYQKHRLHQRIQWRNYRKMAVQLLSISVIYILLLFPWTVLYTAYAIGLPTDVAADYYTTNSYLSYFVVMLTPFVSVMSLPEMRKKLIRIILLRCRPDAHVHPKAMTATRLQPLQPMTIAPAAQQDS